MYKAIDGLTVLLKEAGFNAVTFGDLSNVDTDKASIYPLAHIVPESANPLGSVDSYTFALVLVDTVLALPADHLDSLNAYKSLTNELDIANDILGRINTLIHLAKNNSLDYHFKLTDISAPQYAEAMFSTMLVGYEMSLTVNVEKSILC